MELSKYKLFIIGITTALTIIGANFFVSPNKTVAISGSDWLAGNIIADTLFYNGSSMTTAQVQAFLMTKVSNCDTNGTQPAAEYGRSDITHAQYAALNGWSAPPYYCLTTYRQVPRADTVINSYNASSVSLDSQGALTAAQIIQKAASTYGISSEALIATLQKESPGPLVTDTWPLSSQYRNAMGYGCPDGAPCDPTFEGFYNQVMNAAKQFKKYKDSPELFRYKSGQNNTILYNPDTSCGSSSVYVQNNATAGLYNYTPYQPNAAALANLYGTGDYCSAYGNRNFWRIYNDWFDQVQIIANSLSFPYLFTSDATPAVGQDVTADFDIYNNTDTDIILDSVGYIGRASNGNNRDFGWRGPVTVPAKDKYVFSSTLRVKDVGTVSITPAFNYRGSFYLYNDKKTVLTTHFPNITVTTPISMTPTSAIAGQQVTLAATVTNNEDHTINYDNLGFGVRLGTKNYDTGWAGSGSIAASATKNLSGKVMPAQSGTLSVWVGNYFSGEWGTFAGSNKSFNINPFRQSYLSFPYLFTSDATPAVGQDVTADFDIYNNTDTDIILDSVGYIGRASNGNNRDFGWRGPVTVPAKDKYVFSSTLRVKDVGTVSITPAFNYRGSFYLYNDKKTVLTTHFPNITVTTPISMTPTSAIAGQQVTLAATVTNNEDHTINYDNLGFGVRLGTKNYDTGWAGSGSIAASATKNLSGKVMPAQSGTLSVWVGMLQTSYWLSLSNKVLFTVQ